MKIGKKEHDTYLVRNHIDGRSRYNNWKNDIIQNLMMDIGKIRELQQINDISEAKEFQGVHLAKDLNLEEGSSLEMDSSLERDFILEIGISHGRGHKKRYSRW